ncbi:MAG: hypothetical protein OJF60_001141 [Burkholderiaceae bacterium]|jgi:outer membrane lipoprotein SlyB|nr:MAG: hypothetical protein OJF60_001141 [Burkholderiaceae bacterium]
MNDDIRQNPNPGAVPTFADQVRHSKALLPTLAVLLVTVVALAAVLVFGRSQAQPGAATAPMTDLAAQQPQAPGVAAAGAPGVVPGAVPGTVAGQSAQAAGPTAPAPGTAGAVEAPPGRDYAPPVVTAPRQTSRPVARATGTPHRSAPAAVQAERAPICTTCGTVESVTAIQHAAPTSGVGAIAGGVVGGLVGNQFGGGNGRAAMTLLGAVGGGFAGNAIEKRVKTTTVYRMHIRMEDGRTRTVEQAAAIAVGTPVVVEGNSARAVAPGSAAANQASFQQVG